MKVAFYTVFRKDPIHYTVAELLVRSVRQAMPDVPVVHLTDDLSPPVLGVDSVVRKPHGPMLERRIEHYADLQGDWLLLDTDVVVQADVRDVFTRDFSVAMADRNWPHIARTPDLTAAMPFNTGIVFSRSPAFWRAVLEVWRGFTREQQRDWYSEQKAVAAVARRFEHTVFILPGMVFHYPPAAPDDPGLAKAKIVHYKGSRKSWMIQRYQPAPIPTPAAIEPEIVPVEEPMSPPAPHDPIKVFIGYDPRQPVAYHVCAHSVQTRCSKPVAVTRLQLSQLPITRRGLTEFTYSRFLVPYLSHFKGWSVFLDADVLCLGDLAALLDYAKAQPPAPVHVVQGPRRFEWASVMVFDNARCKELTPAYVQDATKPLFDLRFAKVVGKLPRDWNHLVGYDAPNPKAQLVHFTQGVPIWEETRGSEYADAWTAALEDLQRSCSFQELMGPSVHIPFMQTAKAVAAR